MMTDFDNTVQGYVEEWTPHKRPVHCSNCANCTVTDGVFGTTAHCRAGHGDAKPLSVVIRLEHPRGWKDAKTCPDFVSMDGE